MTSMATTISTAPTTAGTMLRLTSEDFDSGTGVVVVEQLENTGERMVLILAEAPWTYVH